MWWVILSVCIATIVILIALLHKVMKLYFNMCEVFDELEFFEGDNQVFPQKDIIRRYENVTLLYNIQRGTNEYSIIIDTSKYEKNNVIGLTYLVPAAEYDKLTNDVLQNIRRKLKTEHKQMDAELLEETVKETMDGVLIPLCDVYQLKTGRWIWRSKFEH